MSKHTRRLIGWAIIAIAALITLTQVVVPALAPGMIIVAALTLRPAPVEPPRPQGAVIDLSPDELLQHLLVNC